jgi:hypothetical protein
MVQELRLESLAFRVQAIIPVGRSRMDSTGSVNRPVLASSITEGGRGSSSRFDDFNQPLKYYRNVS